VCAANSSSEDADPDLHSMRPTLRCNDRPYRPHEDTQSTLDGRSSYVVPTGDSIIKSLHIIIIIIINFQITSIVSWTLGHRTQLVITTEVSWDTSAALSKCRNTSTALPMCLRDTSATLPKCHAAEVSGNLSLNAFPWF